MYEVILLEDLVAAVEKSVDERLWRHVFYTPIEELRAELRKVGQQLLFPLHPVLCVYAEDHS